jgi:predicted nucleotidyltransferase
MEAFAFDFDNDASYHLSRLPSGGGRVSKQDMIELLQTYLAGRAEVRLAFVFGSVASDRASKMSDVDLAVYLDEESDEVVDSLQADLERLLKREVDLVVMNRAPATLSWSAIRKGVPVKIQSRKFFLDFMLDVSTEAQDFMDFNLHAWRLKRARAAR